MLIRQLSLFALVGVVGFAVDAGVLTAAITHTPLNLYAARGVSFAAAVTTTWALNRTITFRSAVVAPAVRQWLRFSALNALGGLVNLGLYALLVAHVLIARDIPVLAVAAGSLCGLLVNFSLSKKFVFRESRTTLPA